MAADRTARMTSAAVPAPHQDMSSRGATTSPLSFQQEDMLRRLRIYPQCATGYDRVVLFHLGGPVDISCLAAAIHDLVDRHPALRTTLAKTGAGDVQHTHAMAVEDVRVRTWRRGTIDGVAQKLAHARRSVPAICDGAPLFRASINRVDSSVLLAFTLHHLVSDDWSEHVLWRDLSEFYRARLKRRVPELPALPITYGDFARWQRAVWPMLKDGAVRYWETMTADYQGRISWPTSRDSAAPRSMETNFARFSLPDDAAAAVRAAARSGRVPPFLVLMSATAAAFARITGRTDFLLGSNTANREEPFKHDLVGYFTNTRLTRARLGRGRSAVDVLADARENWLNSDEYREVYIDQLLAALGQPAIVKVDMIDASRPGAGLPSLPGTTVTSVRVDRKLLHWRDLDLTWIRTSEGFSGSIMHRLSRVDSETVGALITELKRAAMSLFEAA